MTEAQSPAPKRPRLPIVEQISSGGVAFRPGPTDIDVALVLVGKQRRWQLPKGLVDPGETPEVTAVREVREEAGIQTTLLAPIATIEYWYVGKQGEAQVRFHKFVHFYLLAYQSGEVTDHDGEVQEARWVPLGAVSTMLAFASERGVVAKAAAMIEELNNH